MEALFITYPKCSTCSKANKFLKSQNVTVHERHIVEDVPSEEELMAFIDKSGLEFKKFFNTSGMVYKEMGLKDKIKTLSKEEAVHLLASNGMLIKRPILVTDHGVCVGFKEADYMALLNKC